MIKTIRLTFALALCGLLPIQSGAASLVLCVPACGHWTVGVEGEHHHCACRAPQPPRPRCDAGCSHDHSVGPIAIDPLIADAVTPRAECRCDCDDLPLPHQDEGLSPDSGGGERELTAPTIALVSPCDSCGPGPAFVAWPPGARASPATSLLTIRTTVLRL